jgi:hypothetical protein
MKRMAEFASSASSMASQTVTVRAGLKLPETRILVPGHLLGIVRGLGQDRAGPADDVGARDVLHQVEDARVGRDVPDPGHACLVAVDPVGAPVAQIGHEPVEIGADTRDLVGAEHVEGLHETEGVVLRDLGPGQVLRPVRIGRLEAKVERRCRICHRGSSLRLRIGARFPPDETRA